MKMLRNRGIFRKLVYSFMLLHLIVLMGSSDCESGGGAPKQYDYDLAASGWCYRINNSEIKFYAIVKNVGKKTISGPGQYEIATSAGGPISYQKFKLYGPPYWELKPGEISELDYTIPQPLHPQNKYDFSFSVFDLKQDQNMANNKLDAFVGASLEWIKKSGKECKSPWD